MGNGHPYQTVMAAAVVLTTMLFASTSGCSSSGTRQIQIESAAAVKPYQAVTINYRVDAGRSGLPMQLARTQGQQVSFQETPSSVYPNRSIGTLSIQYPHPDGRTDYALAELIIENDPTSPDAAPVDKGWFGWLGTVRRAARDNLPGIKLDDGVREAWAMDLPRSELDRVLARLSATGYFSPTVMAPQGVKLATKIDGASVKKTWMLVPELDAVAGRIRAQGRLVSYLRPEGYVDPLADPPMAVSYAANLMGQFATMPPPQSGMYQPPAVPAISPWSNGAPPYGHAQSTIPQAAAYSPQAVAMMPAYQPVTATNPFAMPQSPAQVEWQAATPAGPVGAMPSNAGLPPQRFGAPYPTPAVQSAW